MDYLKILVILIFSLNLYSNEVVFTLCKNKSEIKYYKNSYEFNNTKNILENIRPLSKENNVTILFMKNVSLYELENFISFAQKEGGSNYKYYYVSSFGLIQEIKISRVIRKHLYKKYIPKLFIEQ